MRSSRARDAIATVGARGAARLARLAGYNATSLPGLVAERVAPGITGRLAAGLGPVAIVSGTNGKTTTSLVLATVLRRSGRGVVTNPSGANLGQAITAALVARARLDGRGLQRGRGEHAVLEVDEAALPAALGRLSVGCLVLTNLFRDQLDRFGETDRIIRLWRPMLAARPGLPIVYCADDPRLAAIIPPGADARPFGFAMAPAAGADGHDRVTSDVTACPACGGELAFAWTSIGHLGDYACRDCGFARPPLQVAVRAVADEGLDGQTLGFHWAGEATERTARVHLVGAANAYNAAAAVAAAVALGLAPDQAVGGLADVSGPFGRWEGLSIDGRRVVLSLVKNPASLDEVARAGSSARVDGVLFAMNDEHADGRDVSWYWDADPTPLVHGRAVAISGTRAPDFLLRLRYGLADDPAAEIPGLIGLRERPIDGLDTLLARTPPGGTILVVSTYTALLGLRAALVGRGHLAPMPV